jgi:GT2 family glycosyltransferase
MGHYLCNSSNRTVNGDAYAELLLYNFLDSGSNPLIRRQALAQVGGFDKELVPAEDWDMYLRLAARYHFVAVPLPQILYRVSTNSQSTNVSKLEAVSVMVLEQAYKRAPKSLQDIKKQSFANLYDYLIFKSIGGFSDRKRNWEAIKLFWNYIRKKPRLYRIVPKLFLFKTVVRSLFHSS